MYKLTFEVKGHIKVDINIPIFQLHKNKLGSSSSARSFKHGAKEIPVIPCGLFMDEAVSLAARHCLGNWTLHLVPLN